MGGRTMHFLKFLTLAALSITSVSAKKASSTKFDTYFAKQASSAPFEIDEKGYNELTTAPIWHGDSNRCRNVCPSCVRFDQFGPASSADQRCPHTAGCCNHLGDGRLRNVQLLDECLQDQEWWISFLAATLLNFARQFGLWIHVS